eukprot:5766926-Alexandrium_andersonii.AAC.1
MQQSASIRNPPCGAYDIASGGQPWNCAGPGTASKLAPEAPKGCAMRHVSRRFRSRRRTLRSRGLEAARSR